LIFRRSLGVSGRGLLPYPPHLETEIIGTKFPDARSKFHAIMFCEVLEHLKVAPKEILADLKQLLAPGGMIYLTRGRFGVRVKSGHKPEQHRIGGCSRGLTFLDG
jgi:hypothetical protein